MSRIVGLLRLLIAAYLFLDAIDMLSAHQDYMRKLSGMRGSIYVHDVRLHFQLGPVSLNASPEMCIGSVLACAVASAVRGLSVCFSRPRTGRVTHESPPMT